MKRILAIIIALIIILTGCSKAKSNSQDISSKVTDEKVIENASDTEETQDVENSNEITNDNNSIKQTKKSSDEREMKQDNDSNKEINNQYFFKDIAAKKQYTYKGTIWGDFAIKADELDKRNDEGDVCVTAKLNISEVAKLINGKVFEFEFSIYGETNNKKIYDEKAYFWVIDDKIYQFSTPNDFNIKKFVDKNGIVDELGCAKALEKSNQLPSDDEDLIRCSNREINISNGNEDSRNIHINNDICKYSFERPRNSSFEILEWELGKGLTHYKHGFGAKKYGMDLTLVE